MKSFRLYGTDKKWRRKNFLTWLKHAGILLTGITIILAVTGDLPETVEFLADHPVVIILFLAYLLARTALTEDVSVQHQSEEDAKEDSNAHD